MAQSRSYTTQGGETLQNLAQMFLGDKDFWYLIAALNGLDSPDEALPQGKVLHIPAQGTASNSSDAFNPINLNEVLENYLPEAAFVPPPQKGCNAVASIIMIVVAVIATIYTAGAAAGMMGATVTGTTGAAAAGGAALAGGATATTALVASAGTLSATLGVAGTAMASAALGGFVGSVASQLVGKALGAVDSFSLKGALTSGLTAGATAGAGSMLQGADWARKGAEGNQIFNNYGKAALAATATATSVAAGKLVGQQSSFRWGNVAASAVAAGITGDAGIIGQGELNPVNGILNAGIRYGADKLFGNEASWNFDAVAVDAFGNALGNSIVRAGQKTAQVNENKEIGQQVYDQAVATGKSPQEATFLAAQAIAEKRGGAIELSSSEGSLPSGRGSFSYDDSEGFWLSNGTDRGLISYNASLDDVSQFLAGSPAYNLGMGYASQMIGIQQSANASFARGVARGEAMYATGVRNRESVGLDFTEFNRQVDSYVQFRQGQQAQFNSFYGGLNGGEKFLFNAGANLFGGLVSGGEAIGNLTAFTGVQGGDAFVDSWTGFGNAVSDTASYAYNNPVGFAKSVVVDPVVGAWDYYSGIYEADGFGAASGTFVGDALSAIPFALTGFSKPISLPKADLAPLHRRMFAEDALSNLGFDKYATANFIKGIDFNYPVELVEIPAGYPVGQFQKLGRPIGNFLTDIGTDINTLGIKPDGKVLTPYAPVKSIPALRSITSDINVTWEGATVYPAKGGGVQYIIPHEYKSLSNFEVLYYGD